MISRGFLSLLLRGLITRHVSNGLGGDLQMAYYWSTKGIYNGGDIWLLVETNVPGELAWQQHHKMKNIRCAFVRVSSRAARN